MSGAFGKPSGKVARIDIGQIILSVRTKDNFVAGAIESLRRAKNKIPGRQQVRVYCILVLRFVLKLGLRSVGPFSLTFCTCPPPRVSIMRASASCLQIALSKKWGFTKHSRDTISEMKEKNLTIKDGVNYKLINGHGPLFANKFFA